MDSFENSIQGHPVNILAFVLMNNHFHLLIQTPDSNIDQFMQRFKLFASTKIRFETQRINQKFGDKYK